MKGREFKDAMYEGLAKLMRAIANPARLEIIEMLSQGEKSVEGVVEATSLTVANASQHLQVLKNNNIVKSRKEGHYVFYSLINNEFMGLYQHITKYAVSEIAELEKTLNRQRDDNHALNSVSLDELERMINDKNVLLMDVRPSVEYEFGHITGAISVPMSDLLCCLKDFSKDREIIAYCRGPFCVLADEAVKILSENGYKVRRLDEGYPEWKMRHLHESN
ncbi:MAG: metalloregulator ArsR/SmtB family transcription factor [Prolixibacteraceae bacterium]|nr:metalloregulator ArsR/SmtB family transcription factor [Prolixibacteraceae bacterium]MDD4756296.1 metalloregulator ArsR/SmtB family transcription factor [Prolixibacteraceae bacterium]NLO02911.1 metalloregulator ArsR/SmtB family transcription factor [Bacteroidales bacterium]